ncbi:hypothetical protein OG413_02165 [Streptomyces sp. NBC_01433]|uniref:hypothetical protein n=1 Tax=Streptomyces sp. NBC_01433 TaxID=2903864 RepID=UPI00224FB5D8|nr:hypothetical protein [Streptomyces sp. NBC_01433]MCX4674131.1 hypothetical protein [Streptomyces sp. NBC_01433]
MTVPVRPPTTAPAPPAASQRPSTKEELSFFAGNFGNILLSTAISSFLLLHLGAQPFFRYVVHDALAPLGAADRIEGLCHDRTALLESGGSAFRECWEGGSYCHGWSATPSRDLLVHTLGVTPAEPGCLRVRVAPRLGGLSWARGAVPTPGGLVQVDATPERVRIESPVPVEVLHPDGSLTHHPYGTSTVDLRKG